MKSAAIFLCDTTGNMARPWAEAGVECYCVDIQNGFKRSKAIGNIHFVWGDVRSWTPPRRKILFVAAFPPCTHVANSGSQHFEQKGGVMLRDALEVFEACRMAAAWSGAPYCIENPKGFLSNVPHIGKPDYMFHPWQFAGFHSADHYTKETHLWTGNGFVMPLHRPDYENPTPPDNRIHLAAASGARGDARSKTPIGFSRAVFEANAPASIRRAA
jgi:hypothetical protein